MSCHIKIQNVDLYYPSHIYNATTLKQEVFSLLKIRRKKERLDDVHALKNISLEVKEGDRVGIIGLNGAGKSTLLKTIGGIYPVKRGAIEIQGKIRSLFELSLGFDLESTGRENIMYRGLLLGATPKEMRAKQDEIIEFAGLEQFIDYPIRTYSSGMLVRLAFSISTSVSGEILMLDEVIAAGDASFAAKARSRMMGLIGEAKILMLVSHDMSTIQKICNRAILLKQGTIIMDGTPQEVTEWYAKNM